MGLAIFGSQVMQIMTSLTTMSHCATEVAGISCPGAPRSTGEGRTGGVLFGWSVCLQA